MKFARFVETNVNVADPTVTKCVQVNKQDQKYILNSKKQLSPRKLTNSE